MQARQSCGSVRRRCLRERHATGPAAARQAAARAGAAWCVAPQLSTLQVALTCHRGMTGVNFRRVIDVCAEPLAVTTLDGTVVMFNQAFTNFFGPVGQPGLNIFESESVEEVQGNFRYDKPRRRVACHTPPAD